MTEITDIDPNTIKLLEVSLFGASIVNDQGNIIFANKSLLELFQVEEKDFLGKPAEDFYAHVEQRVLLLSELEKNGRVKDASVLLRRSDETIFWASLSFIKTEYAGAECYICWFYDLTDRIEMENSLREQTLRAADNDRLAALVELATRTAHEINNPLTIIRGCLFSLKKELEKDSINKENLETVIEKSSHAVDRIAAGIETIRKEAKKE